MNIKHPSSRKGCAGEVGASLVEYALTVALISIVALVSVRGVGASASEIFDQYTATVSGEVYLDGDQAKCAHGGAAGRGGE